MSLAIGLAIVLAISAPEAFVVCHVWSPEPRIVSPFPPPSQQCESDQKCDNDIMAPANE